MEGGEQQVLRGKGGVTIVMGCCDVQTQQCCNSACCNPTETKSKKVAGMFAEELPCVFGSNVAGGDVGEVGKWLRKRKVEGWKGQGGGQHKCRRECWESVDS